MISEQEAKLRIDNMLGPDWLEFFKTTQAMLCGGALTSVFTNAAIKDFDLYFKSKEDLDKARNELYTECKTLAQTSNSLTSDDRDGRIFQLVTKPDFILPDVRSIIDRFDFTICQAGYDIASGAITFGERFFSDIHKRELIFNPTCPYPISSLFRVEKYKRKGFSWSDVEQIILLMRLREIPILTNQDLLSQVEAVYESRSKEVKELLKKMGLDKPYDFASFVAGVRAVELPDIKPVWLFD